MATEKGIITKVSFNKQTAWIKTQKSSSCAACASRDMCQGDSSDNNDKDIAAINTALAKKGDFVVIRFASASFYKATLLIYIVPVFFLMAGAITGHKLSVYTAFSQTAVSIAAALLFFFISLVFVTKTGRNLSKKKEYQPEIIRIVPHRDNTEEKPPETDMCNKKA